MNLPLLGDVSVYVLARHVFDPRSKGDRVAEYALAWRPSRRLSVPSMWALWLVCLALTPGALALQHATSLQVGAISSIHAGSLIAFLWILLAWLWPVRRMRTQMLALTVALTFGTHVLTTVVLDGDWVVAAD